MSREYFYTLRRNRGLENICKHGYRNLLVPYLQKSRETSLHRYLILSVRYGQSAIVRYLIQKSNTYCRRQILLTLIQKEYTDLVPHFSKDFSYSKIRKVRKSAICSYCKNSCLKAWYESRRLSRTLCSTCFPHML